MDDYDHAIDCLENRGLVLDDWEYCETRYSFGDDWVRYHYFDSSLEGEYVCVSEESVVFFYPDGTSVDRTEDYPEIMA